MSDLDVTNIEPTGGPEPAEPTGAEPTAPSDTLLDDYISKSDADGPTTPTPQDGAQGGQAAQGQRTPGPRGKTDGKGQPAQGQGGKGALNTGRTGQDITLSDGTVVKAGAERRLYDKAVNLQRQMTEMTRNAETTQRQLLEYRTQAQTYEKAFSTLKQLNMTNADIEPALRILAAFRQNPGETINYLLTQAKSAGHNVQNIGGGTVDAAAIKAMVAEQIKPLVDDRNRAQQVQENARTAQQQAGNFFTRYPDARVHEADISRLLRDDPTISLDAAYFKLREFFVSKGFDWSVPLAQHAQRVAQDQAGTANRSGVTMPNGRAGGSNLEPRREVIASEDATYDDIISQAIQERGS